MDEIKAYTEKQLDSAHEALQIAKILVDDFQEDYASQTRDSDPDVKIKAYGLFMQAMALSIYNCHI